MDTSLLDQLPKIVANAQNQAKAALEQPTQRFRLRSREFVDETKPASAHRLPSAGLTDPRPSENAIQNRLIHGDNFAIMTALLRDPQIPNGSARNRRGSIDLIYIDPPFDSKVDYVNTVTVPSVGPQRRVNRFAYSDSTGTTSDSGTAIYLANLTPRLFLMHELLSERGSLYIHLDWHVGHYVKIILDEIFGRKNFRNEIVWPYGKLARSTRRYLANHDVLYFYVKNAEKAYFLPPRVPLSTPIRRLARKNINGTLANVRNEDGSVRYLTMSDRVVDDTWSDINRIMPAAREYAGYATQKPQALLARIIEASCPPDGIVADFYGGSGTTATAAEAAQRNWIVADFGAHAIVTTRRRLATQSCRPYRYQDVIDGHGLPVLSSSRQAARSEWAREVLIAYGARPLEHKGIGYLDDTETLVFVPPLNEPTTTKTLRQAGALQKKIPRCQNVIILSAQYDPAIVRKIASLGNAKMSVALIPSEIMEPLRMGRKVGRVQAIFPQLRTLTATAHSTKHDNETMTIRVKLDSYLPCSPDHPHDDGLTSDSGLSLLDAWMIDPDYDGIRFRCRWQSYREPHRREAIPVKTTATTVLARDRFFPPRVCLRAVDVFGMESDLILTTA